jgi:hypothetical protein
MLEFAAPAEVAAEANHVDDPVAAISPVEAPEEYSPAANVEVSTDSFEEPDEPGFASAREMVPVVEAPSGPQSTIGRAILASRQSAWPDMAAMKLVPAELAPASVRPAGVPRKAAPLAERISTARSTHPQVFRDKRFWRVPIVAGIAAVLALSTVWFAGRFSGSRDQAGPLQEVTPRSVEAATPANGSAVINSQAAGIAQSSPQDTQPKPARKIAPSLATTRVRPQHIQARRHYSAESDYVAKDTTIYFPKQTDRQQSSQKPQARP